MKPNAVPTLFNVPNPPPRLDLLPRRSLYKNTTPNIHPKEQSTPVKAVPSSAVIFNNESADVTIVSSNEITAEERLAQVLQENERLRIQLKTAREAAYKTLQQENQDLTSNFNIKKDTLAAFLNTDQLKILENGRITQWNNESIIKALKFKFALSVHGYEFLRKSGYPLPAYSTIMRKTQDLKLDFGIFSDVLELLSYKVESMEDIDKFSVLSYDEMAISEQMDYDKNSGKFFGFATLGDEIATSATGQKIFLVIVRGIKNRWKQVIACHVTRKETIDPKILKKFMLECISSVENCGLRVLLLSSDLDGRNRALWTALNIQASKNGLRVNSFVHNNHDIYVMPDPCHLLKNLKAAMLRQKVYLPSEFVDVEKLPSNVVDGSYVARLWYYETSNVGAKRLLHHIKREDIEHSNFDKMHVGAAIRFFSPKTASALKTAVELKILPEEALSTAEFILIIDKWFAIIASKVRKTSITARNCDKNYIFLHSVIDLFQNIVFKENWKPLNYGFVLATLSFGDMAEYLFLNGFDFVLGDRFLQDGTENIFSQIRRKEGKMPTALKCLSAIKGISVSQYVSDCKRTSYTNDSDNFLLNFCAQKRKAHKQFLSPDSSEPPPKRRNTLNHEFTVQTYEITDFSEWVSSHDANSIYFIAGSTTNSMIKHVCDVCVEFLKASNLPDIDFIRKAKHYTKGANKGGLKDPCKQTFCLILHCEHYFNVHENFLMRNNNSDLIKCLFEKVDIVFPECCDVKHKIIKHFFNVRSYCVKNYYEIFKPRDKVYGSASAK